MEDKNQNMIPDKYDRLILRVGFAVVTALGSYGLILKASDAAVPMWFAIAGAVIPGVLMVFAFKGGAK